MPETRTSEVLNRSRREQYKQRFVGLNERRRAKQEIVFPKTEWDAVVLMRDDLMRHFKLMSSETNPDIRKFTGRCIKIALKNQQPIRGPVC